MKKYLSIALFFEIAACIGAYFIQYFTAKKMGMLRWVNHLCNKWSKSIELDSLNLVLMLLISAVTVALLFWTITKAKERSIHFVPMMVTGMLAVAVYLVWTIRYTRRLMAAYYLVSPILLLGSIIVLGCWAHAVWKSE